MPSPPAPNPERDPMLSQWATASDDAILAGVLAERDSLRHQRDAARRERDAVAESNLSLYKQLRAAEARVEALQQAVLLAKSHTDWLHGFLGVEGAISNSFREAALAKTQQVLDALAACSGREGAESGG